MSKYHVLCIIQTRGKILNISFHVRPINNPISVCFFIEARSQIEPVSQQKLQHFRLNSNLLGFSAILKLLDIFLRQFQDVLGASVRFWTRNWHLRIFISVIKFLSLLFFICVFYFFIRLFIFFITPFFLYLKRRTTQLMFHFESASAVLKGSNASGGAGVELVFTAQNRHPRVHVSPSNIIVPVPLFQHSPANRYNK